MGRHVQARGGVFSAETGHHHTELLLTVQSLTSDAASPGASAIGPVPNSAADQRPVTATPAAAKQLVSKRTRFFVISGEKPSWTYQSWLIAPTPGKKR